MANDQWPMANGQWPNGQWPLPGISPGFGVILACAPDRGSLVDLNLHIFPHKSL
jgi:hypothetical protein